MKRLGVLLVDDEIMIREGFKRLFDWETHGCEVVGEAVGGMEALAKIDALVPDIVIMDINIPIMNGLKVIELARMKHPDMAFVVVSGYDDFSYCREALRLKITDYILKPVNYEEFGACIDNLKIARFQKTVTEAPTEQGERTITGLTRYLQAHLAEDISLGMLSDEFHLSAQYISQLFKSEIGVMFILMSLLCRLGAVRSGRERAACQEAPDRQAAARRGGGCLFFWFCWKNNECSPLFWVYLRQKGGDHYDWNQKSRQIHGAAPQGADRISARTGRQPDTGTERGAERDAVLL